MSLSRADKEDQTVLEDACTASEGEGNEMWLSPELLRMDKTTLRVSIKGDVWAYGCVYLQVLSFSFVFTEE